MRQEPLSFPEEEEGLQEGLKHSWWQSLPEGCVCVCVLQH